MKRYISVAVLGLVACANQHAFEKQKAELEARRAQRAAEEAVRRERQDEARRVWVEEQAARARAAEEARRARLADWRARGYEPVSFEDFVLDYKTVALGSKRVVGGFYQVFRDFETLAARPMESPAGNTPRVVVLSSSAPREVRAKLLQCRQQGICRVMLLGHTAKCTVERFGYLVREDICLAVDGMFADWAWAW